MFVCLVVQEGESFGMDKVFHISHFTVLCPGTFFPDKTNSFIVLNRTIGRKVAAWPVWPHIQFQFGPLHGGPRPSSRSSSAPPSVELGKVEEGRGQVR